MAIIEDFAKEFIDYEAAKEEAGKVQSNEMWAIEDKAFAFMLQTIGQEAATALYYRGKSSEEQHDSADQNALDTVYEAGLNPDSDAGRLVYYRIYVETMKINH